MTVSNETSSSIVCEWLRLYIVSHYLFYEPFPLHSLHPFESMRANNAEIYETFA